MSPLFVRLLRKLVSHWSSCWDPVLKIRGCMMRENRIDRFK
jgi:hypothetical protein